MSDPTEQGPQGASWLPDPSARHQFRYWDGRGWTDAVSDGGVQANDPLGSAPPQQVGYGYAAAPTYQLSSKGKRFGAALLEALLVIVTLFIGWVIWWVILWKKGQSPAKSLLKMRVIKADTGRCATTGDMAMRELVGKLLLSFIPLYGLIDDLFVLIDDRSQALHDKIAGTLVIDDPDDRFAPAL
jgi:uncharacterized RDD family membrane protein YckC